MQPTGRCISRPVIRRGSAAGLGKSCRHLQRRYGRITVSADRRGSAAGSSQTRVRPTRLRATLRAVHSESSQIAAEALTVRRSATATPATTRIKGRPTSHRPGACSRHPAGETASGGSMTGSGAYTAGISWRDLRAGSRLIADRDFVRFGDETDEELLRRIRRGYEDTEAERRVRRWRTFQRDAADTVRINRQILSETGADTPRARGGRATATAGGTRRAAERTEATADAGNGSRSAERRARSRTPTRTAAERGEDSDPFETSTRICDVGGSKADGRRL